ncbi:hypothetical protein [Mesorhizobium sp. M7A.F.Ca.MR.362.00.0.0]|uniref:hypothetical protein n=1 Tax=Mesorhizobium sp. M7A.F.Ca.MR.362.00.0.0 TaxID=2496779 RepID=UPI000FD2B6ED|nr:hypothetical protein [Mesorhizobium sp. M7A.F.Ca.MR.362.00.0.0]RUU81299.1 hypothetical protein EOC06_08825 [Mesorhizobium sp. M7A.F.Ca.MR.362.00.0.0]
MTILASTWLALAVLLCAAAWFAKRRVIGISLPVAVTIAALAVYIPTGSARFTKPPPGDYAVVGADIQVNVAIYVLLKEGSNPPVFYKLPYSNSQADKLQQAMDGEGGVKATVGDEGGVSFDGPPPVTGAEPKTPEVPALTIP